MNEANCSFTSTFVIYQLLREISGSLASICGSLNSFENSYLSSPYPLPILILYCVLDIALVLNCCVALEDNEE